MLGEITKTIYIYSVTAEPAILDFLENQVTRSFVNGLMYRARRWGREECVIKGNRYEVVYDSQFHYRFQRLSE
jgi:hypothetical protein